MQEHDTVQILLVCEQNTALATFVAIFSLKKHHHSEKMYHVHVLSVGLNAEQEQALQALATENMQVSVYSVDSEKEDTAPQDVVGILSLQLANIFWELEKALYMAVPTIIQSDLQALYAQDLGTAYAALAMHNHTAQDTPNLSAHVMLLHLEAMREHKVVGELMACNVAKGDFTGYTKALEKVLSPQGLPLAQEHVHIACLDSDTTSELTQDVVQLPLSLLYTEDYASHTARRLWHNYASKAREEHSAQYAVLIP